MESNGKIDNDKEVKDYKDKLVQRAENLVKIQFPIHIVDINKELKDPIYALDDMTKIHAETNIPIPKAVDSEVSESPKAKKRKLDTSDDTGAPVFGVISGVVPLNTVVAGYVDRLKPRLRTMVDEANTLKMWVAFLIPKIEDGNNFGVGIQEETLEEIRGVESDASSFYEAIARYFLNRGKLLTKVAKYPHIEDYRRAVVELDEKQLLSLKVTLVEMRNHYAALHDMIVKNWEKIKTPRSANSHAAMY